MTTLVQCGFDDTGPVPGLARLGKQVANLGIQGSGQSQIGILDGALAVLNPSNQYPARTAVFFLQIPILKKSFLHAFMQQSAQSLLFLAIGRQIAEPSHEISV